MPIAFLRFGAKTLAPSDSARKGYLYESGNLLQVEQGG
jgi:hypothetical protein